MYCNKCERIKDKENMKKCLDLLSKEQRMVLLAYYYDNLSIKRIADAFEISEGAVRSRLYLARKRLLVLLEEDVENQEYSDFISYVPTLITALNEIIEADIDITREQLIGCYRNTCAELARSS